MISIRRSQQHGDGKPYVRWRTNERIGSSISMPVLIWVVLMVMMMMSVHVSSATVGQPYRDSFVGIFDTDTSFNPTCIPGGNCCCSSSPITLKAGTAATGDTIEVSGSTDGSDACYGLPVLSGTFTVYNHTTAINYVSALKKYVIIRQSDNGDRISLFANDNCVTVGMRQGWGISSSTGTYQSSSTAVNVPSSSTGTNTNTDTGGGLVFVPPLPSTSDQVATNIFFSRQIIPLDTANQYALQVYVNATSHPSAMQWVVLRASTGDQTITAQMYPYSAYLFEYRPLLILPAQTLSYTLTFKEITSSNQYDTPVYTYTVPPMVISSSSSSTGMDMSSSSSSSSSGIDDSSSTAPFFNMSWLDSRTIAWLGTYDVDSTCHSGDDCCCSVGHMVASPSPSSSAPGDIANSLPQFAFLGAMDGGTACAGRTNFAAVFTISNSNSNTATYSLNGLTFTATLSAPSESPNGMIGDLGTRITLVNSVYPQCISVGYKSVAFIPFDLSSSSSSSSSSTGNGEVWPSLDYASMMVAPYEFDSSCQPSKTCCCGVSTLTIGYNGTMVITAPSSSSPSSSSLGVVVVDATFDGGLGCFGFASIVALFVIDSPTTASYETAGMRFTLTYSNNYSDVSISNTYMSCISVAHRRVVIIPHNSADASYYDQHASLISSALIICATMLYMVYRRNNIMHTTHTHEPTSITSTANSNSNPVIAARTGGNTTPPSLPIHHPR